MTYLFYAAVIIVFVYTFFEESNKQLHMVQLEGYKPNQYLGWIKNNYKSLFISGNILFMLTGLTVLFLYKIANNENLLSSSVLLFVATNLILFNKGRKNSKKAKKPLVYTNRAKRLFAIELFIFAAVAVCVYLNTDFIIFIVIASVIIYLLPLFMLLAVLIAYPIEMLIQRKFFIEAQNKIRGMKNLKVIGITGSYGKTSTKYFVQTILSEKYNTIMTPESYNTPMGITRVIREQLKDEHEVFVCEMGARYVGDIKTLCKLAGPSIGILTSIGKQHLETFKGIENVVKTKYELIEALPADGTAIFNGDNEYIREFAKKTKLETLVYGIENSEDNIFIRATDILNTKQGLKFRINGDNGFYFECQTALLGKHNISNILAAVCVALKLGLTQQQIKTGIMKIKPVPHRLEIVPTNNGVTVVDDAFNSNPVGAKEALEAIKELEGGNKIIITPGMIELGAAEFEENRKFGEKIAECCDYAILVGTKRSKPILDGLKSKGFPEDRIFVSENLDKATAMLGKIVKSGDVVLFENDLPDNYNEE